MTNINFRLTVAIKIPEQRLSKLIKRSPKRKSILGLYQIIPTNSQPHPFKKMYDDSLENLNVDIAWGLKG